MKNKVTFDVKLDEDMYRKLAYVANAEGMTLNNYILHLARTNISYFERVKGKIKPQELSNIALPAPEEN